MRRELRTGTPGNVPGEAETGLFRVLRAGSGSQGGTGGQPAMKLPRESQASQWRDPCLFWVAHLCVQLTRSDLGPLLSLTRGILFHVSWGEGRRAGWDRPEPPVMGPGCSPRDPQSISMPACACLLFQRAEQAYLLVVVGGREGEGSLASWVGGRLRATEEAVGGGTRPVLHNGEDSDLIPYITAPCPRSLNRMKIHISYYSRG